MARSISGVFAFFILAICPMLNTKAQCTLAITLADTINACGQSTVTLNPTVTGGPPATNIRWTPTTGLSSATVLNPTLTVGAMQKYNLSIYSIVSGNLIVNPAFTAGNTAFTNGYLYQTSGPTSNAYYFINTNPQTINPLWPAIGDHTSGNGNMLIVDAAITPNVSFWCQTVPVTPNTYYELSAWTALLYPPSAKLKFNINGSQVGAIHSVDSPSWKKYEGIWFSGSATSANICISDTNLASYGNDFAIDDIALHQICIANDSVFVNPALSNVTAGNNGPVCVGSTLSFSASATGPVLTYNWSGPNGFTSTQQNPSITNVSAAANGVYTVTITGPQCNTSLSTTVTVNAIPSIPVVSSNSPVCTGQNINLTANSTTPGVTYNWTGPGSYSSSVQNPVRANATLAMAGTYNVSAILGGCASAPAGVVVTVNPTPANLTVGSNTPVCTGNMINLTANATTTGVTFSWTGPAGFTSGLQNPTLPAATVAMSGIYTVTAQLATCSQIATTNVVVGTTPATPSASSNSPLCEGQNINLTALSSTPGVTYNWSGPGGYFSGSQNPVRNNATVAMAGTYSVTAILNGCSSPSANTNVVITPSPAAPVATNNGPLCTGMALHLFASGTPGATYQWSGPGSYSSNAQNPTIPSVGVAVAGTYTVTQTMAGCTSAGGTTNVVISNSVVPDVVVYPSPNDTVCHGVDVIFVASAVNGGTTPQYQWYKNGNLIPGANGVTYLASAFNSGDYYHCALTSSASCAVPAVKMSNAVTLVIVPPAPAVVNIAANPGLILSPWQLITFTATPVMGGVLPSYQWLRNGQPVIGAVSNTWGANNLANGDTISVILYSTDPCALPNTDTSNMMVVQLKTGISKTLQDNNLVLYPNPNRGNFTVRNLPAGEIKLEIVNSIGQVVHQEHLANGHNADYQILANISPGVYIFNISSSGIKLSGVFSVIP